MEATPSWLCLWLQNSVRMLVLPVKICSILRITKVLMKDLCILSGSTCVLVQNKIRISVFFCKLKNQTPRFSWIFDIVIIEAGCFSFLQLWQSMWWYENNQTNTHNQGTPWGYLLCLFTKIDLSLYSKTIRKIWMHTYFIRIMPLHFLCSKLVLHRVPKVKYFVQKVYFDLMQISKPLLIF